MPWETTEVIARRAAVIEPEPLLRHLEDEAERARSRAIRGDYVGRGKTAVYISAEICATVDEELQAMFDLLRDWCGAAAAERDELGRLRQDARRLVGLVERAIRMLDDAGLGAAASALDREIAGLRRGDR